MSIMGELALIFGICLVGEGVAAILPVAFPASVISMMLLMVLLLTGTIKDRHIERVTHFLVANMAFFFLPSFVGLLLHIVLLLSPIIPLLISEESTATAVYLVTAWTVRLLMLRRREKGRERNG